MNPRRHRSVAVGATTTAVVGVLGLLAQLPGAATSSPMQLHATAGGAASTALEPPTAPSAPASIGSPPAGPVAATAAPTQPEMAAGSSSGPRRNTNPRLRSTPQAATVGDGCPSTPQFCIAVDATSPIGRLTHAAAGFLHATQQVSPTMLAGVPPTSWRVNIGQNPSGLDTSEYDTARRSGAAVIVEMSDAWFEATSGGCNPPSLWCGARPPWADLSAYSTWVRNYVRSIEATGRRPDYWDIQNEPDGESAPGTYFNAVDASTVTADREMAQFDAAYQAIESVDPTAKPVGPSLGLFRTVPDPQHRFLDLTTFLDYSAAHRLVWSAVTWHENSSQMAAGDTGPLPNEEIPHHVAVARAMVAARPSLGTPELALTEYGAQQTYVIPGWTLGEIAAIESSQVAWADRTCWDTLSDPTVTNSCFRSPSTLDGLLLGNGLPTAGYWLRHAYTTLAGQRLPAVPSDVTFSALAALGAGQVIRTLVGRHATCTRQVNLDCSMPASSTPPPADVALHLRVPWGGPTDVLVQLIPNVRGAVNGPTTILSAALAPIHGSLTVILPEFSDGDAFSVEVRPSGRP